MIYKIGDVVTFEIEDKEDERYYVTVGSIIEVMNYSVWYSYLIREVGGKRYYTPEHLIKGLLAQED